MQPCLPFDTSEPNSASPEPLEPLEPFERKRVYPAPVFVRHPRARRYVISVREDGGVRVTLPRWGSMREARAFAGRLDAWIDKQRHRLERDRAIRPTMPDQVR